MYFKMSKNSLCHVACIISIIGAIVLAEESRINGGENAKLGQFPFIVSLQYCRIHFCAGSIIGNSYILTAAHCLRTINDILINYDETLLNFTVVAGTVTLDSGGDVYSVHSIPSNTEWFNKTGKNENDFAVIRIKGFITFTKNVKIATMSRSYIGSGSDVYILGWGYTKNEGLPSNTLKFAKGKIISDKDCANFYKKKIHKTFLCTLGYKGERTCKGDSGGPLVKVDDGKLIGVESQGGINCDVTTPDIYSRIYYGNITLQILHLAHVKKQYLNT